MRSGARLLAAAFIFILASAAGCSPSPSGKIVVQAPVAPATAPLLVMQEAGWSPGSGVEMDLIIYKSVEEATTRVMKGEADCTILPVNVAAKLYNKGVPVKLANVSTWGLLYLVSGDPDVKRLTDLRGRELYVGARGATPDILTRYLLAKNGIGKGEADIKYAQSPEIAQMIIGGLARTAVLPEPLVTQVTSKKPSVMSLLKDVTGIWSLNPRTVICVTHDIAEAALLGQRVLVFSGKPAVIRREFNIDLPLAERKLGDGRVAGLMSDILGALEEGSGQQ